MADKHRTLGMLGISDFDESTYRALLSVPDATLAELADGSREGPARVAPSLERLEELGLIARIPGKPQRFAAVSPEAAVEALVLKEEQQLARARGAIEELTAAFRTGRRTALGASRIVEVVEGRAAGSQRFTQLQAQVTSEMLILDRPPYVSPQPTNPTEAAVLTRGISWRAVYAPESLETPGVAEQMRELAELGEDARVHPEVPMKLAVADRRTALIPLESERATTTMVVVHESALVDALVTLFNMIWHQALPLDLQHSIADSTTPEADRRLLTLLVSGLKDESVARHMRLSPRTLRRRTARLMQELGARTRFQAGALAYHRGWITTDDLPQQSQEPRQV